MTNIFEGDFKLPQFYADVSNLENLFFFHGKNWVDRPHYIDQEQFYCTIEGVMEIDMIPHVYRQEIYTGQTKDSVYHQTNTGRYNNKYTSPMNFFTAGLG